MNVKINGKKFDFDSDEIYAGEKVKSERMIYFQYASLSGLVFLLIFWVMGGYQIMYPIIRHFIPHVSHWVY